MDLVNARIVTEDVAGLAAFYAEVLQTAVVTNDYYVELPAGAATLALCRRRFTEADGCGSVRPAVTERIILDFEVDDIDAAYERLATFTVSWVMSPTDQPWGARSAMFRDPDGNPINLFSRTPDR